MVGEPLFTTKVSTKVTTKLTTKRRLVTTGRRLMDGGLSGTAPGELPALARQSSLNTGAPAAAMPASPGGSPRALDGLEDWQWLDVECGWMWVEGGLSGSSMGMGSHRSGDRSP